MIVCICNVLSESACRAAACNPECRTVGCVYRQLGCKVRCGKCVPMMAELFQEARAMTTLAAEADDPTAPEMAAAAGNAR